MTTKKREALAELEAATDMLFEAWVLSMANGCTHAELVATVTAQVERNAARFRRVMRPFTDQATPEEAATAEKAFQKLPPFFLQVFHSIIENQKGRK